jgi:hypothetical protein
MTEQRRLLSDCRRNDQGKSEVMPKRGRTFTASLERIAGALP